MPALTETPAKGAIADIIRATQRLNPVMELDVDVLAVTHAAVASTAADWNAGVLTSTAPDSKTGALRLTPNAPATLFSQTNSATVQHSFHDSTNGPEELALDFFPDPSITQGVSFTLSSLALFLAPGNLKGVFRIIVAYYDEKWRKVDMGTPVDVLSGDVVIAVGLAGVYPIDFIALGRTFVFQGGQQDTTTGSGRDNSGALRVQNVDPKTGKSHMAIARGLSISIQPVGPGFQSTYIGMVPNATATSFAPSTFWRVAPNRNCGPYNTDNRIFQGGDTLHNPDPLLTTGAVPGFGAIAVTNGQWGIARRVIVADRAQSGGGGGSWEQPYHVLKVQAYPSTGTWVGVLDLQAVPVNDVQLRLDDWQQTGTSLTYTLQGSNISATGAWTSIGAVVDGQIFTGANLYRWYQLTATFTPGPSGATKYASPALQAWAMVERIALPTYRYLKDIDATVTADPLTSQSSIAELKLPVLNAGRQDFRDLQRNSAPITHPLLSKRTVFSAENVPNDRIQQERSPGVAANGVRVEQPAAAR